MQKPNKETVMLTSKQDTSEQLDNRAPKIPGTCATPNSFTRMKDPQTYRTGMGDYTHRAVRPGADDHVAIQSKG